MPVACESRSRSSCGIEPFVGLSIYFPFFWRTHPCPKHQTQLRQDAAKELQKSLNGGSPTEKADNRKRAAAYTSLAENEEWLAGEGNDQQRPDHPEATDALGMPDVLAWWVAEKEAYGGCGKTLISNPLSSVACERCGYGSWACLYDCPVWQREGRADLWLCALPPFHIGWIGTAVQGASSNSSAIFRQGWQLVRGLFPQSGNCPLAKLGWVTFSPCGQSGYPGRDFARQRV